MSGQDRAASLAWDAGYNHGYADALAAMPKRRWWWRPWQWGPDVTPANPHRVTS